MWSNLVKMELAVIVRFAVVAMIILIGGVALAAEEKAAVAEEAVAEDIYPLGTCVVTGQKLGSMGEPVTRVYKGQEVQFCCAGCIAPFESDPDKYMEKLHTVGGDPADATHDHKKCGGH